VWSLPPGSGDSCVSHSLGGVYGRAGMASGQGWSAVVEESRLVQYPQKDNAIGGEGNLMATTGINGLGLFFTWPTSLDHLSSSRIGANCALLYPFSRVLWCSLHRVSQLMGVTFKFKSFARATADVRVRTRELLYQSLTGTRSS
jgi:hypothetical protein